MFRWGQPVTIVCGGPAWADAFRLEKENRRLLHKDQKNLSPRGSHWVEIRFHVNAENEFTAGRYFCHYHKGHSWSEHSETLELKVADKDISTPPSGLLQVPAPCPHPCPLSPRPCLPAGPQPCGSPVPPHSCPLTFTPNSGLCSPGPFLTP